MEAENVQAPVLPVLPVPAPQTPPAQVIALEEEKTCRLCYSTDEPDTMYAPCACTGTSKWIHRRCMLEQLTRAKPIRLSFSDRRVVPICSICRHDLRVSVSIALSVDDVVAVGDFLQPTNNRPRRRTLDPTAVPALDQPAAAATPPEPRPHAEGGRLIGRDWAYVLPLVGRFIAVFSECFVMCVFLYTLFSVLLAVTIPRFKYFLEPDTATIAASIFSGATLGIAFTRDIIRQVRAP